ncbi:MAG: Stk1 family PASTA domain-containing Ser/Thr kinase, partial [Lactobacillus sp.]
KPTTTTVKKTFTVQYSGPYQSQVNNDQGTHIQICIKDSKHDLTNVYQDSYIKKDTNFTVSLLLQQEDGEIKVLRDGKTVLEERVAK